MMAAEMRCITLHLHRVCETCKEKRVTQYLEVGSQADDGQMAEFVSLCWGQLWKRGCSLYSSRQEHEKKEEKKVTVGKNKAEQCVSVTSLRVKHSHKIEAQLITLKCNITQRHAGECGAF